MTQPPPQPYRRQTPGRQNEVPRFSATGGTAGYGGPYEPMGVRAPRSQKPPKKKGRFWLKFLGFLFTAGCIGFFAVSAAVAYYVWDVTKDLPDYEVLAKYEPKVMSRIHANDGNLIAEFAEERRIYVPINAIPDRIIHAFISAEDKNFYEHDGLDYVGLARAMVTNVKTKLSGSNKRLIGASTITQQVAKNFLLTNERKIDRKVKEAVLARRIEQAFTKGQILELYLNEIYFGLRSHGIAAAALNYFGKSLEEITIPEAAYLAALPKAPNNYHPFKKRQRAITRRKYVINRMLENGYITDAEAKAAIASEFKVNPRPFGAHILAGEFFAEGVRRTLVEEFGQKKIYGGGLSVRTTLDPELQRKAKKALVAGLVDYDQQHGFREPVAEIALTPDSDWGVELAQVEALKDVHPWRLAIVLQLQEKMAVIGLQPKKLVSGKIETVREVGEIQLENMNWARKHLGENKYGDPKLGKKLKSPGDILKVGDVVYVAPTKAKIVKKDVASKDGVLPVEKQNQWKLMQIPEVEGAIVVMEPHTGRVKALVGGFSFDDSEFDRATQANRQPGSAFKPFVYAAALDNGYTPSSVVLDTPVAIDQGNGQGIWRPKNYSGKFNGPSTLRIGIEKSRNLMTVRLAQDMGMPLISEYARRFGIYDNLMPVLSMSLGAGETTLIRLTTAYSILANGGKKVKATLIDRIQDRYGKTVWSHDAAKCNGCEQAEFDPSKQPKLIDQREQIIDPHTAYQITSMLEGVVLRGTARKAMKDLPIPVAGKTGTTNDARDAWFVGFSADLAVGVFVGQDVPRPMGKKATGGGLAAPIFKNFMQMALADKPAIPFRIPPGIKLIPINSKSGLRSSGGPDTIMEAFKPGNGPPDASSVIYDDPNIFIPDTDRSLDSGFY